VLAHERFVFDTIISLTREEGPAPRAPPPDRHEVARPGFHRRQPHHAHRAGVGVHVYRRAQSRPVASPDQPTSEERLSTGSPAIDKMMDGGIYKGSVTLVSGISGTGKTVLSVQFLTNAIKAGHKTLLVSLDEHPRQLIRNAKSLGFDLQAWSMRASCSSITSRRWNSNSTSTSTASSSWSSRKASTASCSIRSPSTR
jgi:circadian clock protein KaiC